jgi:hypothetical protein
LSRERGTGRVSASPQSSANPYIARTGSAPASDLPTFATLLPCTCHTFAGSKWAILDLNRFYTIRLKSVPHRNLAEVSGQPAVLRGGGRYGLSASHWDPLSSYLRKCHYIIMTASLGAPGASRIVEIVLPNRFAFLAHILVHLLDPFWHGIIRSIEDPGDVCT